MRKFSRSVVVGVSAAAWISLSAMLCPVLAVPLLPPDADQGSATMERPVAAAFREGLRALTKNDLSGAGDAFRKAILAAPKEPLPHLGAAEVALRRGNSSSAEASLKTALQLAPRSPFVLTAWSRYLLSKNDFKGAATALEQTLTIEPNSAILHQELGDLYATSLNDPTKAADYYKAAIAIDGKNAATHYALGNVVLRVGKPVDAKNEFELAAKLKPDNALAWSGLGAANMNLGNYPQAESAFSSALKLDPKFFGAQIGLGDAMAGQRRIKDATAAYQKAKQLDPRATLPSLRMGVLLGVEGQLAESETNFRQALLINPKDPEALNALAFVLAERKANLGEALLSAEAAVKATPNEPVYQDTLAWVHRARGEMQAALPILQAITAKTSNPDFFYHLGVVYSELGKKAEAMAAYDAALRIAPTYRLALNARRKLGGG